MSDENERLIRATVSDLTLAEMSKHLKKVMEGYDSEKFSNSMAVNIKKEPEVSFIESKGMEKNSDQENKMDDEQEVYYGYQSYGRNRSNNRRPWRGGRARGRNNFTNRSAGNSGSNPPDQYGNMAILRSVLYVDQLFIGQDLAQTLIEIVNQKAHFMK